MKWLALFLLLLCSVAFADIRPGDRIQISPGEWITATAVHRNHDRRDSWMMTAVLAGMTVADYETAYAGVSRGSTEGNPFVRSLMGRGRLVLYGVTAAIQAPAVWMLFKNENRMSGWKRSLFIMPLIGIHTVGLGMNLRY